jgi:hypothetical protein
MKPQKAGTKGGTNESKTIIHIDSLTRNPIKRSFRPKRKINRRFNELVWIPQLFREQNFELEILMVEEEEIRCNDGRGSTHWDSQERQGDTHGQGVDARGDRKDDEPRAWRRSTASPS